MFGNESFVLILMLRTKVPGDERGMKVPGDECSRERMFQGTKVQTMELSFPGTKVLWYEKFQLPTVILMKFFSIIV